MRGRIARGLTIAFLVSLGAAQGPNSSGSARNATVPSAVVEAGKPGAGISKTHARPYQVGTASWYGEDFEGKPTASGEPYNMYDLTAAHPTLPLGTYVKVTNLRNRRAVVVRVNDRGPIVPGRIIDLSYSAAKVLKFQARGIQRVRLDVVPRNRLHTTMALLQRPVLQR
jgi:peptidoglycan lytic transglycosylase